MFGRPGAASDTSWPAPFATHERAGGLAVLSMHTYIGPNTAASVAGMLASTDPGGTLARQWSAMAAAKAAGGIGQWRMTEANSYFHGGAPGVSAWGIGSSVVVNNKSTATLTAVPPASAVLLRTR